jgi:hypothetical protein
MAASDPSSRSWSLIDLGAGAAVVLALVGVIWSPKLSNAVARATGGQKSVTVTVDVRGIPSADPQTLRRSAEQQGKVSLLIRNQPHGSVRVAKVLPLERRLSILSPDGKLVSAPDPNQKVFSTFDGRFLLVGEGVVADGGGIVFGNQTLKIGAPVELEGSNYRFNGTVTDLKIGGS